MKRDHRVCLNKEDIARDIAAVLELPVRGHQGKAFEIVKTVFKVMIDALHRGEKVRIIGFGTFYISQDPPRRQCYVYNLNTNRKLHVEWRKIVPRPRVKFRAHKSLKDFIKQEN